MASRLFKHPPSTAQPPSPSRPISAPAPALPRSLTARLTARARNTALPAQPQPIPASHAPLAQAQENGISPIRTPAPACPATLATPPDLRSSPSTASIPHRTADGPIPKTRSAHSTTAHPSLPRTGLRRRRKRASHLFKHPPSPAQPPSPHPTRSPLQPQHRLDPSSHECLPEPETRLACLTTAPAQLPQRRGACVHTGTCT